LIKILILLLPLVLLVSCSADDVANNEIAETQNMLKKQKPENHVIFSPMEGVLIKNGKPLANAIIIRRLKWNGNDDGLVEEFTTDEQGLFSLSIHEEELSLSMLNQFVASTDLEVVTEKGSEYLWTSSKFFPEIYSETNGKVVELVCDITSQEIAVPMGATSILTKCRWKDMPE
jgi:hypothetical protein